MAPLKEKNANIMPDTSPNTSCKRKSDTTATQEPSKPSTTKADAPAAKRARKAAPSKSKPETKSRKEKSSSPAPDPSPKPTSKKPKEKAPSRAAKPDTDKYDVTDITLDGESTGTVPIYDTASDLCTKINTHTRTAPRTHSSNAALVRAFTASYPPHLRPAEGMSPRSLKTFLAKKGPSGGVSMPIYYGAYVYFEKLRLKQDKKKTKKRTEMEESWGSEGVDTRADLDKTMTLLPEERVKVDKYGHIAVVGGGGRVMKEL